MRWLGWFATESQISPMACAPGAVRSQPVYLDRCVLLSLFLGDSGYDTSEQWLLNQGDGALWISHWELMEFAGGWPFVCGAANSPSIRPG